MSSRLALRFPELTGAAAMPMKDCQYRRGRGGARCVFGIVFAGAFYLGIASVASDASAAKGTRFWNLTSGTIKEFRLAPAGTTDFGKNQCENDKDGTVDHDERLPILGIASGRYDARVIYVSGKTCMARGLEVKEGKVFSIDDHDLKDCK
jgi:hypothetical protein